MFDRKHRIYRTKNIKYVQHTVKNLYPMTENKAAKAPISSGTHGCNSMSAAVPIATPPANVAF